MPVSPIPPHATRRPLSPHLQIYKPQFSSLLSILHRASGVALGAALPLLSLWLVILALGESAYNATLNLLSPVGGIALILAWPLLFSLFFHLLNGLRHLAWDIGLGFNLKIARASGWSVTLAALLLTLWVARTP